MTADLHALLERRRAEGADLEPALYVRPEGRGLHRVALVPGGGEVVAGSLIGDLTLAPESAVVLGSFAGRRQKLIMGLAPPGYRGASVVPLRRARHVLGAGALAIRAAVPSVLFPGVENQAVYVVGRGFRPTPLDVFEAVIPAGVGVWAPDPWVVLRDPEWIADPAAEGVPAADGASVVRVRADVASAAPEDYAVSVRVHRPEAG